MRDREEHEDPLDIEHDQAKREGVSKEGPPVGQMASTYGSSFIVSEQHADEVAADEENSPKEAAVRDDAE